MKKIIQNSSIYSLGSILTAGISFFLLPLYTRVLNPEQYGQLELVYIIGSISAILFGLNIELGYTRFYYKYQNQEDQKALYFSSQIFKFFCGLFFLSLIILNKNFILNNYLNYQGGERCLYLILISSFFEAMCFIPQNNLRIKSKAILFISGSVINLITTTAFTACFVIFYKFGVEGVLLARLIGNIISFLYYFYVTKENLVFKKNMSQVLKLLSFSIFLIPINFSSLILNMSNRYFLSEYQSLNNVGLFSLSVKITAVIPILISEPIKNAFLPYIFELSNDIEKSMDLLSNFVRYFFVFLSVFVLAISLYSQELIDFIIPISYSKCKEFIFILSLSNLFLGASALIVTTLHIANKTWVVTLIWILSSLFNVYLNIKLIPVFGMMGAAYATLISMIFVLMAYIYSGKLFVPFKLNYILYFKLIIILILFYCIGAKLNFPTIFNLLAKTILILFFVLYVLKYSRILTNKELILLKNKINSLINQYKNV